MRARTPWIMCAFGALLVAMQFIGVLATGTSGHVTLGSPAHLSTQTSSVVVVGDDEAGKFVTSCPDEEPAAGQGNRDRHRPATEPQAETSTRGPEPSRPT